MSRTMRERATLSYRRVCAVVSHTSGISELFECESSEASAPCAHRLSTWSTLHMPHFV